MSGSSDQTSTTSPQIPSWLGKDSKQLVSQLMTSLFPGGNFQQYNPSMNQQVAGFSPLQQQSQQGASGAYGQAQQTVQGGAQANQLLTDPNLLYANSNPYLKANVQDMNDQITDAYKYGTAPSSMSDAVLKGAFGGSGQAVKQLREQFDLSQSLGSTDLQAYNSNYQNQLGVLNNASQAAGGVAGNLFAPSNDLNQFGNQQQQQGQNVLNANTTNAWQQEQFPFNLLQQASGILSPYLGAFSGSKSVTPTQSSK